MKKTTIFFKTSNILQFNNPSNISHLEFNFPDFSDQSSTSEHQCMKNHLAYPSHAVSIYILYPIGRYTKSTPLRCVKPEDYVVLVTGVGQLQSTNRTATSLRIVNPWMQTPPWLHCTLIGPYTLAKLPI